MAILSPRLPGARVLDLYAGSGALGLEALSRGAAGVTFVERSGSALRVLRDNVELLGAGELVEIVRADAAAYAEALDERAYDLAVADPPYGRGEAARLLGLFRRHPFASELWVEHRSSEPIPELPAMERRRYGDTILTGAPAGDSSRTSER